MRKRLPLPSALVLLSWVACVAGCGSSDDTPSQPGNSTTDSGADVATPDAFTPDALAPPKPDAGMEASVSTPEPTPEAGPADAAPDASPDATVVPDAGPDAPPGLDLDACSLPDGGVPNLPINDSGATTATCLACINTTCATQAAACNGDCICAGDVVALLICTASGQSAQSCLNSTTASGAFGSLALCVGFFCGADCGL